MLGGMSTLFAGVVWGYAAFLVIGGLMGFLMAGSKISLVVSSACALTFVLVALRVIPPMAAPMEAFGLAMFFGIRALSARKPMPGLPLAAISLLAAALMAWQLWGTAPAA